MGTLTGSSETGKNGNDEVTPNSQELQNWSLITSYAVKLQTQETPFLREEVHTPQQEIQSVYSKSH